MAEIVLDVSARLKVLQSSVAEMQKVLDKLQPNSAGFRTLSNIIATIRKDMDKLQLQTEKPFGSQAQFNQAEKSIDKIEESLGKAQLAIQRIDFKDLKLDESQKQQFADLANEIARIKQEFDNLKNTSKNELFQNNDFKAFADSIDSNLIGKSFDEVVKIVTAKSEEIDNAVNKAKASLSSYSSQVTTGKNIENMLNNGGLTKKGLGQKVFDNFFLTDKNGVTRFKSGKKSEFFEYCKQKFSLTDSQIEEIKRASQDSYSKLQEQFLATDDKGNSKLFGHALKQAQTAANNEVKAQTQLNAAKAEQGGASKAMQALGAAQEKVAQGATITAEKIEGVNERTRNLQDSCTGAARGMTEFGNGATAANNSLQMLKDDLERVNAEFIKTQRTSQTFNSMKMAIVNFMGFNQVLNMTKRAVKEAMDHIKSLDSVMNGISIVTNMSTSDLWGQVDAYSAMAQKYGVTIQGAYEVSKIYYQQGLETADVMTLTNETLKLSKISGLDYATTTDYMTTAIRGFKMEMSEASKVVDVYSALAANTAVSQQELAEAMTRTASSMEGVGTTFQDASAMIATIVAVTRESANNIGSAMKSIASRYGELTKDPAKLMDSEGEAMSFNRVDTALQSVGISMKTAEGQFRDFTSVIVELAEKWNTLESTQQRYIATQFAGNRQQSRFLALVSNADLLKANMDVAANSEDTGTLQALKALDSIESKINQVQVAYQQFYTTIGAENIWKGMLDGAENLINTLNGLPKLFGKIPLNAVAAIANAIGLIKNILTGALSLVAKTYDNVIKSSSTSTASTAKNGGTQVGQSWIQGLLAELRGGKGEVQAAMDDVVGRPQNTGNNTGNQPIIPLIKQGTIDKFKRLSAIEKNTTNSEQVYQNMAKQAYKNGEMSDQIYAKIALGEMTAKQGLQQSINQTQQYTAALEKTKTATEGLGSAQEQTTGKSHKLWEALSSKGSKTQQVFTGISQALTTLGMIINKDTRDGQILSGVLMGIGGTMQAGMGIAKIAAGDYLSGIMNLFTGVMNIINGIDLGFENDEEKLERLTKEAETLSNKAKEEKANYNILDRGVKKLEELRDKRYESAEAAEEYQAQVEELANKFPALISGFDEAGNVMIDTTNAEAILAEARRASAEATYKAAQAEVSAQKQQVNNTKGELKQLLSKANAPIQESFENSDQTEEIQNNRQQVAESIRKKYVVQDDVNAGWDFERLVGEVITGQGFFKDYWDDFVGTNDNHESFVQNIGDLLFNVGVNYDELTEAEQAFYNLLREAVDFPPLQKIQTLGEELTADDVDYSDPEIQEKVNEYLKLVEEYVKDGNLSLYEKSYLDETNGYLTQIITKTKELNTQESTLKGLSKAQISLWQNTYATEQDNWKYLSESAGLGAIVAKELAQMAGDTDWDTYIKDQNNLNNVVQVEDLFNNFWNSLNDTEQQLLNTMLSDQSNFTAEDIIDTFNISKGSNLATIITNFYTEGITSIQEGLKQQLSKSLGKKINPSTGIYEEFNETDLTTEFYQQYAKIIDNAKTSIERSYLTNTLKQYDSLRDEGYTQRAENFGAAALGLFKKINAAPADIEKILWATINENGLETIEGIEEIKSTIENNSQLKTAIGSEGLEFLDQVQQNIIPNINLAIQTATSNLFDTWEDTSKELTKAMSGGVTFKEADALINKAKKLGVDINLSSFENTGDKLILTATEFDNYWKKLNKANQDKTKNWQKIINEGNNILAKAGTGRTFQYTEDQRLNLQALGFNISDSKYYNRGELTDEGIIELNRVIAENQKNLNEYNLAAQIAADQLKNSYDRMRGIYKLSTEDEEVLSDQDLRDIAKSTKLGKKDVSQRAIKESLNSVYDKLISDVLAKGFDNINTDDYEGLIADANGIVQSLVFESYQQFVQNYVDFAGKTVEETNALIVQAIEKDKATRRSADDIVKNFKFIDSNTFTASLNDLQNLANTFGKNINDWIKQGIAEWDSAAQAYKVNKSAIDINWDGIENIQDIIQDSINEYINALVDSISKGISGKLNRADKTNLESSLANLGITNLNLDFTKTEEGLKLSQQSAIALYNELRKFDSIQSKLVFDDLRKSLEDSDESYQSVSSIMTHIRDLQNNINEANREKNSAKKEQYEQELAVAKEILAVRSQTDDDSFKFMDQALPSGQNNPLNYYDAMNKANKAISDAFNMGEGGGKGYMGYQDFYNIITQLGQIAEISGEAIHIGKDTLRNMTDAANLIQAGAGALASVDGGEMKVNLGQIGIDMKTGASQMRNGLDSGLKTMAQEQIKMLDAAIAMLEAVVAMEDLGKLDTEGNGVIELGELGITIEGEDQFVLNNVKQFEEAATTFKTVVEGMKATADEIFINGHSLSEVAKKIQGIKDIDNLKKALGELGLSVEDLQSVFNNFYKLSKSEDWGKEGTDVISMIQDVFAGSGLSIDVNPFSKIKINYKDADVQKRIEEIFKQKGKQSPEAQMKALETKAKEKPKTLTWQDAYNLNYVAGKITVKKDKNGKEEYWYDGKKYSSKEEVGNIISIGTKTRASNVKARKNKDGVITGYEGTLSFQGTKYKVVTDKNGKNISYEYNGQKNLTLSQVQQKIALDNFSKQQKGAKKTTTTIGKDNNREAVTYKMGSEIITVVADDNGNIQYKGKDGKLYNSYNDMIDAEIRSEKGNENKKYISDKNREEYEIKEGYKIIPKFEKLKKTDLNQRNINNLKETTGEALKQEWKDVQSQTGEEKDKAILNFKYKYGFTLEEDESSADDLQGLIDDLNKVDEEKKKNVELDTKIVGDDAVAAKKMLEGEKVVVPVEFEPSMGDHSTLENGEENTQTRFTQEVTAIITEFIKGPNADPNTTVNALAAIIASYTDTEASTDDLTVAKAIMGIITAYNDDGASTNDLKKIKSVEALVDAYTDADGNINTDGLATTFVATADAYKDATREVNTDLLTTMFTAVANKYKDADGKIDTTGLKTFFTAFVNQYAKSPDGITGEDELNPMVDALVKAFAEAPDGADKSAIEALISNLEAKIAEVNAGVLEDWYEKNKEKEITISVVPPKGSLELPQKFGYDIDTNESINTLNEALTKYSEQGDWNTAVEAAGGIEKLKAAFVGYKESINDEDFIIDFKGEFIDDKALEDSIYLFITEHSNETLTMQVEANTKEATDDSEQAGTEIESNTYKINIDANMDPAIATIKDAKLPPRTIDIYGNYKGEQGEGQAAGNVSLASGNAMASGTKTLMGELGPELVVSRGRYFVAGQNGAEFVDLDKDAIVFNHLQTQSLLKNGKASRGKAKTNERNAVGMAAGNVSGPALASASAALANLRQIRAMWESLLDASVQDLAQKGGGGGGGGNKKGKDAAWLAEVERWYNWLQRIAQLEKDINYEETLRNKIQSDRNVNGKAYVDSLVRQLEALKEEEKYQASLADSQEAFFKKRRNEMNKSAFSQFYTFDKDGQLKYNEKGKLKNGDKGGFTALSDLMATNPNGSTKYTAEQQYNKIKAWGFGSTMLYDSSGKKIEDENKKGGKHSDEFYTQSVQAFWDKIESDKEEMQKLRDSIDDANTKVLEMEQKRNELIKEMRDNQMDLEDKLMDALQNKLQSKIDEMQKKRDAYDKANQKFIKGLQDSLSREQDMYQRQEDKTELDKMRRQLAILQRSGGSASSIAALQNDIRGKEQDQYFDERQAQIDAIQTASDKQLERMDLQISIAQETLDYQKRMGLLWSEVYKIMGGSEGSILNFLSKYSTDFTTLSVLGQDDLKGQWKAQIEEYKQWQKKQQENEVTQKWNVAKKAIGQSEAYSKVYGTGYKYTNSKGKTIDVDAAAEAAFKKEYARSADENQARQKAAAVYAAAQKNYDKEQAAKKTNSSSSSSSSSSGSSKTNTNDNTTHGYSIYDRSEKKYKYTKTGFKSLKDAQDALKKKWGQFAQEKLPNGTNRYTYRVYKHGGEVNYTGLAQVDGTPSRPEAFFNAEQTKILKNGLLGNSSRILANTLEEFNSIVEGMANGATYNTIDRGSSLVIENASVNMNVQSIANDYDARRAGEQALEQMMKIARKSGTKGVSRR